MRRHLSATLTALALLALAACGTENGAGGDSDRGSGSGSGSGKDAGKDSGSVAPPDLPLTGVRWTVDSVTADGRKSAAPAGAYLEITKKGRVQGHSGCNRFSAAADLTGTTLTVQPAERTTVACTDGPGAFERTLDAALTGELKAALDGDRLTLKASGGDSIALSATKPVPLTGTTWMVNSLLTGDVAESMPAGTEQVARLVIAPDGTVSGSLGCNTFRGRAKVTDSTIELGRLAATRRLCTGPAEQVEAHLRKVLDGTVGYVLRDGGLALTGPANQGLHAVPEPTPKR
ncbi:META domain-containing protein [Streptomyces sp. NPDC000594]|uniref:META domain-containing protein n=1 Tax=Streptomyces sp. NPDC000594 TaxID=3154261 RepID=UPI00332445C3